MPEGVRRLAPDLVVEVVSPSGRFDRVEEKTRDDLEHGVRVVRLNSERTLRDGQALVCDDVRPGFAAEVAKLFPSVPVVRPENAIFDRDRV